MSIPKWDDYKLEMIIDKEKLYLIKKNKTEKFHNPYTLEKVIIPPYISYIFANNKFNKNKVLTLEKIFNKFSNL
jgi:hypothetical protein